MLATEFFPPSPSPPPREDLCLSALSSPILLSAGTLGLAVWVSNAFCLVLILFKVPPCPSLEHCFPVFQLGARRMDPLSRAGRLSMETQGLPISPTV